eukprot:TRINITY_DN327_c0_g1_i3.p1 TRINITY_DN327_c0_g1~~TRINITY_DN327_c0_g1_i3.p1  ORF type:complete len:107 (-),score=31.12 TRINITY_DN327_c0_g1_i3:39-359(-)
MQASKASKVIVNSAKLFSTKASAASGGKSLSAISFMKDQPDPVVKEDSEYPAWLWGLKDTVLLPKKAFSLPNDNSIENMKRGEFKQFYKAYNKHNIKTANFLKSQG